MTNSLKAKIVVTDEKGDIFEGIATLSKVSNREDDITPKNSKILSKKHNDKGNFNLENSKLELAKQCKINVNELDDVLYFKDNTVTVVSPLTGSEPEKQVTASKCILTVFEVVFGQTWVKALDLSNCVRKSKIEQLNHLAENLQKNEQFFRLQGKGRSAEYKITTIGKTSAFEIIRKLAKGEK